LMLDKWLQGKKIVWKDSKRKGIDQSLLYKRFGDSVWELKLRSGTYILCRSISKEISKAVNKPFAKSGKPLRYRWDKDRGIQGTARCQHRDILSLMPGPCGIGQSTPIVILSHSALLRSLTDIVERITPLPKYITRLIVEYAYLDDNALRFWFQDLQLIIPIRINWVWIFSLRHSTIVFWLIVKLLDFKCEPAGCGSRFPSHFIPLTGCKV